MNRVAFCAVLLVAVCAAQAPQFDVASIRPSNLTSSDPSGCQTRYGFLRCSNVTLKRSIRGAYEVLPDQILGGPDWIDTDRFEITARTERPLGDKGLMEMLQTLLAQRFQLAMHRESRVRETMVLEVAKSGSKLQRAGDGRASMSNMHDHLEAAKLTMSDLAEILSRNLNLPVVDRTGLTGAFTFTLRWDPGYADSLGHDEGALALRSEVSAAIQRQLGLTLKSRKAPVQVLVIDYAEKPSEN
jgi:uncharacterized protein (TIGR03435 family)